MREPLLIECMETDRREWLDCLHRSEHPDLSRSRPDNPESVFQLLDNKKGVLKHAPPFECQAAYMDIMCPAGKPIEGKEGRP